MFGCKEYSFLLSEDTQILHDNRFDERLIFSKLVICRQLLWSL